MHAPCIQRVLYSRNMHRKLSAIPDRKRECEGERFCKTGMPDQRDS